MKALKGCDRVHSSSLGDIGPPRHGAISPFEGLQAGGEGLFRSRPLAHKDLNHYQTDPLSGGLSTTKRRNREVKVKSR